MKTHEQNNVIMHSILYTVLEIFYHQYLLSTLITISLFRWTLKWLFIATEIEYENNEKKEKWLLISTWIEQRLNVALLALS